MTQYDPGTVSPLRVAGCESWGGEGAQLSRAELAYLRMEPTLTADPCCR